MTSATKGKRIRGKWIICGGILVLAHVLGFFLLWYVVERRWAEPDVVYRPLGNPEEVKALSDEVRGNALKASTQPASQNTDE